MRRECGVVGDGRAQVGGELDGEAPVDRHERHARGGVRAEPHAAQPPHRAERLAHVTREHRHYGLRHTIHTS